MRQIVMLFFIGFFSLVLFTKVYAEETPTTTPSPSANPQKQDLENKIQEYQSKLSGLRQQKNSLASEIAYADTQINLTELNIAATEEKIISTQKEIELISTRIEGLDTSLDYLSKLLLRRAVDGYKRQSATVFDLILDSSNANQLINKFKYFKTVQGNNEQLVMQVQETKSNFQTQKELRENKKLQLDQLSKLLNDQKIALDSQKAQKQKLLADTNNDEATYQRLLSSAQAQLASFGRFVSSQGGAGLLSNQTVCDDWGCYYSQRDSQWGNTALNGSRYTLGSDGCLVTSMAMVYTHYGHKGVTPVTINDNPNNFASYFSAYLLFTISADGMTTSRIGTTIDSTLANGDPVVVGVNAYGGTHFVVLVSGSGGDYIMNDPYIANGHKISFNDHYSVGSIFEIKKVVQQ